MLFLALKQLFSKPSRTALALFGIILGTAAFFILSGFMLGFRELLVQRIINSSAHIRISAEDKIVEEHSLDSSFFPAALVKWIVPPVSHNDVAHIQNPQGWFDRLEREEEVLAFAPLMTAQVLLNRGKISRPINLVGVEAEKQVIASDIQSNMTRGNFLELGKGGLLVIMGESLGQKMGLRLGDNVGLVNQNGEIYQVKVTGFFSSGVRQLDDATVYAPLIYVQQINHTPGQIASIIVRLKEVGRAAEIATLWAGTSVEKVESWDQANANFLVMFKMQDMMRYILSFVVLLVAAFGIYNILNMIVLQKRGEVAILRSMGFDAGDITVLFLSQGILLGFIRGLLGLLLGTLVCLYLQTLNFGTAKDLHGPSKLIIAWHTSIFVYGFLLAFV